MVTESAEPLCCDGQLGSVAVWDLWMACKLGFALLLRWQQRQEAGVDARVLCTTEWFTGLTLWIRDARAKQVLQDTLEGNAKVRHLLYNALFIVASVTVRRE